VRERVILSKIYIKKKLINFRRRMGSCFSNRLTFQCYCNRRRTRRQREEVGEGRRNEEGLSVSSSSSSNNNNNNNNSQQQQQQQQQNETNFINLIINDTLSLNNVPTGRNKRLKRDKFKWKSDISLNELELEAKRDEFWDTAPAFGGRVEIWNALKAICNAIDTNQNYELAQVIVDSVQIIIPNGSLTDCYDELGNHYQLPNYVITKPTNLKKTTSKTVPKQCDNKIETTTVDAATVDATTLNKPDLQLKFRLSNSQNNSDLKLIVGQNQTIEDVKKKINELKQIEPKRQRMYFGGKILNDKLFVKDLKLDKNFVIQVIIRDEDQKKS
jgi:hypothetical protein